ncbi:uncharacterized protein LOC106011291 [Aplysia californica]|uniref:Uncharacterized protein LOC106011291 n=1 Tax=Aplysia californica TaxID=6500 RepID=A0ABM1VQL0_APLCA|nr:uncharacterized protein LOC106011291 [Aplysia californica]
MDSHNRGRGNRGRLRALSPIREVSGIVPVQVVPKGTKLMKGASGHAPILVQALPPEVTDPKPKMKPSDRHYTAVDQVVADYLHYARYGQVAPVLYGGGAGGGGLNCACCVDRNRENVARKLALQRGDDPNTVRPLSPARDLPEHYALPSTSQAMYTGRGIPSSNSYNDNTGKHTVRFQDDENARTHYHSPRTKQLVLSPPHAQEPWTHYQPTPYAGTFLNPEFNRPFVRQSADEESVWLSIEQNHIFDSVLEADSKFKNSMDKLQTHLKNNFTLPQDAVLLDKVDEQEDY